MSKSLLLIISILFFVPAARGQSILLRDGSTLSKAKKKTPVTRLVTPRPSTTATVKTAPSAQITFAEFRDANKKAVLTLIQKKSGLQNPSTENSASEISLRVENLSWKKLQEAVLEE